MNKAFVKEDDAWQDPEIFPDPGAGIPEGAKNYMTPAGARKLQQELEMLLYQRRPEVIDALNHTHHGGKEGRETQELKKALRRINSRIDFLSGRLELTEVVDPATQQPDRIRFGAGVRIAWKDGRESIFHIVGIDEADAARGCIAWTSPMAGALLGKREGDIAVLVSPSGKEEIEIIEVTYAASITPPSNQREVIL